MTNIIDYLNSLKSDIIIIDISDRDLTELPDLSRFKKLKQLYCGNNQLTSLPHLNNNLEQLHCRNNQLTYLPPLNKNLKHLSCHNNQLTFLPPLNNLEHLYCYHNQLTYLPSLNDKLWSLGCSYNKLTSLPNLNDNLTTLFCYENPINEIIGTVTKRKINKWNHFREFYFILKLRKKFISWLWKSRESKIREQFHPSHLINFLKNNNVSEDDTDTLNKFLNIW